VIVDVLAPFVHELRTAGVPVGVTEHVDAARAVTAVSFADRALVKQALGATLAKTRGDWVTFETVFDAYFSVAGAGADDGPEADAAFARRLEHTVALGDDRQLRLVAREAVRRFAALGTPPGGVHYHLFRTARRLGLTTLPERALAVAEGSGAALTPLESRLARRTVVHRVDVLRDEIEDEIRRRGVLSARASAERPPTGVLPTDLDFRRASADELEQIRAAIQPLARRLAARLATTRRTRRGRLDLRQTIRRSLGLGGVPLDPVVRHRRRSLPELMVLADVSRSVAAFSGFTLQLVQALSSQFGRVRSFAFVDGIEEVTDLVRDRAGMAEVLRDRFDGHSDYGAALQELWQGWGPEVTHRTTLLILGDARNNQHASRSWVLGELRRRARRVYWLNPEPTSSWDTGDSLMSEYATFTTEAVECRNLAQLERFVERCC